MKKIGTLNTHLSRVIARMGHTDCLVVCDCGLPIPHGSEVVDLAVRPGLPGFLDTLDVVLEELAVERAVIADELVAGGNGVYHGLVERLNGTAVEHVSHERFKAMAANGGNTSYVRTGEASPYANVMLCSGVTF
ncbi:D-ribose pyranase [Rubrivirga sp.]|uniref:D-ribose pyranase n=1 Tax=Rubrivirga sp. TaxID=1885344 RepID=UPI003B522298